MTARLRQMWKEFVSRPYKAMFCRQYDQLPYKEITSCLENATLHVAYEFSHLF